MCKAMCFDLVLCFKLSAFSSVSTIQFLLGHSILKVMEKHNFTTLIFTYLLTYNQNICAQLLYLLDQKPLLLIFSSCSRRLQLESGYYSRVAFVTGRTHVPIIYYHVMMPCELDMIKTTS